VIFRVGGFGAVAAASGEMVAPAAPPPPIGGPPPKSTEVVSDELVSDDMLQVLKRDEDIDEEISSNVPKPKKNSKGKQNKRGQPLLIDYRGPENRNLVTEDDEDLDGATASTATPSSASAWSPNARPLVSSQAPARQRPPDQGPTDKSEKVDMLVSMTCC
ncbi:unnamed protein product, partial [Polarella glacialis]